MKPNFYLDSKKLTIGVLLMAFAGNTVLAEDDDKRKKRRGPPPEAIEVCEGRTAGDVCDFTSPRGDLLSGVCFVPPKDGAVLACKPEGHDHRRPHHGED
ncbi:MAG: hypothetical protein AAF197_03635 [Pseudomonadota bacterium]